MCKRRRQTLVYLELVPTSTRPGLLLDDDALERPSSSGLSPASQTEAAKEKNRAIKFFPTFNAKSKSLLLSTVCTHLARDLAQYGKPLGAALVVRVDDPVPLLLLLPHPGANFTKNTFLHSTFLLLNIYVTFFRFYIYILLFLHFYNFIVLHF